MSKQRINIDRLEIRLRHISPAVARSAVNGLGQTLLDQLSSSLPSASANRRAVKIEKIDPGTLQVAAGQRPGELRNAIGAGIARAIRSKLK